MQVFWDCSKKKLLGTKKSECSVTCEWSPDGWYLMTAMTASTLQIDNGYGTDMSHLSGLKSLGGMRPYTIRRCTTSIIRSGFNCDVKFHLSIIPNFSDFFEVEWKPETLDKFGDVEELTNAVKERLKIDSSNKGCSNQQDIR
ncbi:hypothetical protein EJ110_NYTH20732 [Nymphaea thermarum]|nr:hypothetical protein EJ110_NYTH20732 [Nymphaea thermarum]